MRAAASSSRRKALPQTPATVHLLDGNLLYALIDQAHVHHAAARQWFVAMPGGFATCPITQGTLLRLAMRLGGHDVEQGLALLAAVTRHPRHHFWPDAISLTDERLLNPAHLLGHRQLTDAYLLALAVHHGGQFVTLDGAIPLQAVRGAKVADLIRVV